jgi:hypothetical protein
MIELNDDQLKILDSEPQPGTVVDPRTGQVYRLIKQEVYSLTCATLKPYGRGWDDPADDDLIRKDL